MKLSLVPKEIVDKAPNIFDARMAEDFRQLRINAGELTQEQLDGFKDLGLVEYDGAQYYAAIYTPPASKEDELACPADK